MNATEAEAAVLRWHGAVNRSDPDRAHAAVTDPVVVNGPRGAGPITAEDFVGWVARSGIRLRPVSFHVIGDRVIVVDQVARWAGDDRPSRVATLFRITGEQVSAALRFAGLDEALAFADLYVALAATD